MSLKNHILSTHSRMKDTGRKGRHDGGGQQIEQEKSYLLKSSTLPDLDKLPGVLVVDPCAQVVTNPQLFQEKFAYLKQVKSFFADSPRTCQKTSKSTTSEPNPKITKHLVPRVGSYRDMKLEEILDSDTLFSGMQDNFRSSNRYQSFALEEGEDHIREQEEEPEVDSEACGQKDNSPLFSDYNLECIPGYGVHENNIHQLRELRPTSKPYFQEGMPDSSVFGSLVDDNHLGDNRVTGYPFRSERVDSNQEFNNMPVSREQNGIDPPDNLSHSNQESTYEGNQYDVEWEVRDPEAGLNQSRFGWNSGEIQSKYPENNDNRPYQASYGRYEDHHSGFGFQSSELNQGSNNWRYSPTEEHIFDSYPRSITNPVPDLEARIQTTSPRKPTRSPKTRIGVRKGLLHLDIPQIETKVPECFQGKATRTVEILKCVKYQKIRARIRNDGMGKRGDMLQRRGVGRPSLSSKSRYLPFKNVKAEKIKKTENINKVLVQLIPQNLNQNHSENLNKENNIDVQSPQSNQNRSNLIKYQMSNQSLNLSEACRNLEEFCYDLPVVFDCLPECSMVNEDNAQYTLEPGTDFSIHTVSAIMDKEQSTRPVLEPISDNDHTLVNLNDAEWFPSKNSSIPQAKNFPRHVSIRNLQDEGRRIKGEQFQNLFQGSKEISEMPHSSPSSKSGSAVSLNPKELNTSPTPSLPPDGIPINDSETQGEVGSEKQYLKASISLCGEESKSTTTWSEIFEEMLNIHGEKPNDSTLFTADPRDTRNTVVEMTVPEKSDHDATAVPTNIPISTVQTKTDALAVTCSISLARTSSSAQSISTTKLLRSFRRTRSAKKNLPTYLVQSSEPSTSPTPTGTISTLKPELLVLPEDPIHSSGFNMAPYMTSNTYKSNSTKSRPSLVSVRFVSDNETCMITCPRV